MIQILSLGNDEYGVYAPGVRCPDTGLALLFRGTLEACIAWRREQ